MNHNLTDITLVLDKSGSMNCVRADTLGSVNAFIRAQKQLKGKANLTIYTFADHTVKLLQTTPLEYARELGENEYHPRGNTALYDAIKTAVDETGQRLAAMPEQDRPGKVLVAIITDGEENKSRYANAEMVRQLKQRQETVYNWQFVYLGANHDSFAQSGYIGFAASEVHHQPEYTNGGIARSLCKLSASTGSYRSGNSFNINTDTNQ